MAKLPPGFVLDPPQGTAPTLPPLPPGFVLEGAAQPEHPGMLDTAMGVGKQAIRGLTLGFGDELAAGASALTGKMMGQGDFGPLYDRYLAANREEQKAFEAQHPWLSLGAQAAGGMLNPLGRLSQAGTLTGRVAGNALTGALLGGATGFGEGEGVQGRLGSALAGGAAGGVLGAALPAAAEGVGNLARRVAPYVGVNVPATDARRMVINSLQAGGQTPASVKAQLDPITGQPMALPDVGGEDVLGLAQYVGRKPGPGMVAAREFVEARGGLNQSARLVGEVQRAISAKDFLAAQDDLIRSRAAQAGPAYERALAIETPVNVAPILDDINARLGTAKGDIRAALQKAAGVLKNRNGAPDTTLAGLHQSKLALDAMLEKTPSNSISRVARREIAEVQQKLLAAMDEASGGAYGQARQAFAGDSRSIDAMNLGASVLKGDATETAQEIAKLSPSERDFFRIGVARALKDRIEATGDTADLTAVNKIWGSQATRDRVRAAFDDPKEFDQFAEFMAREIRMAQTNNVVNPRTNSPTAQVLMRDQEAAPVGPMFQAVRAALRGDPLGVVANTMPRPAATGSISAETAAEIAPYLFTLKAGDRARLIDALIKQESRDQKVKRIANPVASALMRGTVVGTAQAQN